MPAARTTRQRAVLLAGLAALALATVFAGALALTAGLTFQAAELVNLVLGGLIAAGSALIGAYVQARATTDAVGEQLKAALNLDRLQGERALAAELRQERRGWMGPFVSQSGRLVSIYGQVRESIRRGQPELAKLLVARLVAEQAQIDHVAPLETNDVEVDEAVDAFLSLHEQLYWEVTQFAHYERWGTAMQAIEATLIELSKRKGELTRVVSAWVEKPPAEPASSHTLPPAGAPPAAIPTG